MNMLENEQWAGFEGRIWREEINVRDFIQKNYKPYDGDESFLTDPTDATNKLWGRLQELQKKGGLCDALCPVRYPRKRTPFPSHYEADRSPG